MPRTYTVERSKAKVTKLSYRILGNCSRLANHMRSSGLMGKLLSHNNDKLYKLNSKMSTLRDPTIDAVAVRAVYGIGHRGNIFCALTPSAIRRCRVTFVCVCVFVPANILLLPTALHMCTESFKLINNCINKYACIISACVSDDSHVDNVTVAVMCMCYSISSTPSRAWALCRSWSRDCFKMAATSGHSRHCYATVVMLLLSMIVQRLRRCLFAKWLAFVHYI